MSSQARKSSKTGSGGKFKIAVTNIVYSEPRPQRMHKTRSVRDTGSLMEAKESDNDLACCKHSEIDLEPLERPNN